MKIILSIILTLIFALNSFSSVPVFTNFGVVKTADRDIAGTVTDKNNKLIEGLKVRAINAATKRQYKTKTNESGFFKFTNLSSGTYTIRFEGKKGFLPKTIEKVEVGLNGGTMYNTTLEQK